MQTSSWISIPTSCEIPAIEIAKSAIILKHETIIIRIRVHSVCFLEHSLHQNREGGSVNIQK